MDPVTAFGLACNVIQVTAWGLQALKTISDISEQKGEVTAEAIRSFEDAKHDAVLAQGLHTAVSSRRAANLSANDLQLLQVAKECSSCAMELTAWYSSIDISASDGKLKRLLGAAKAFARSTRTKELKVKLETCQSRLNLRLLTSIMDKIEKSDQQQEVQFKSLTSNQEMILSKLRSGQMQLKDLLTAQTQAYARHVILDGESTRRELAQLDVSLHSSMLNQQHELQANIAQESILHRQGLDMLGTSIQHGIDLQGRQLEHSIQGSTDSVNAKLQDLMQRFDQILATVVTPQVAVTADLALPTSIVSTSSYVSEAQYRYVLESLETFREPRRYHTILESTDAQMLTNIEGPEDTSIRTGYNLLNWLKGGSGIYVILGGPGVGKSTLLHFIYDNTYADEVLTSWSNDRKLLKVFFSIEWRNAETSTISLLKVLVYKLLEEYPGKLVPLLAGMDIQDVYSILWTEQMLRRALSILVMFVQERLSICCFIDGLDEFAGDPRILDDELSKLAMLPYIKLCVTTRKLAENSPLASGHESVTIKFGGGDYGSIVRVLWHRAEHAAGDYCEAA